MFLRNAWYCAGWDEDVTQGKDALVTRKIAGQRLVLYRIPSGRLIALADRCPHRRAALSLGRKEGDFLRCMYHGMKFAPDGTCVEVPGQSTIPDRACVRTYPVIEKDNWIWVWMGDPEKADPGLVCSAVGPGNPDWIIKTSQMHIQTNYRLEIANLADLSHVAWVHDKTVGGSIKFSEMKPRFTLTPRGLNTTTWVRSVPVTAAASHLFPDGTLFDIDMEIQHTVPCNWIMNFRLHLAGTEMNDFSNGQPVLDTWTCQSVTPCDEDSVDYYYSWGVRKDQYVPGLSEMLRDTLDVAFKEDAAVLEAQHLRMKESANEPMIDLALDAGPGKMLWVLDSLLKAEAREQAGSA